jgi:hypothetical protein
VVEDSSRDVVQPPLHPFAAARDAAYRPPTTDNVAAKPKPPPVKKPESVWKTTAPVYDPKVASDVYARTMNSPITLTQRELLSLSPEVRNQVREATSNRRVARAGPPAVAPLAAPGEQNLLEIFSNIEVTDDENDCARREAARLAAMPAAYSAAVYNSTSASSNPSCNNAAPPSGATIIPDPYETYLRAEPEDRNGSCLTVARESSSLRTVLPLINHSLYVEAVIDPGSQVISMSEAVCHALGLSYDPRIKLRMQSANGEVDETLGLARNVPLLVGEITLYVQVHIIRKPAYDVLLGRPFDTLTESIVRNFGNEDQTLTIHDPNTGSTATIPTFARGTHPRTARPSPDFCDSRI